MALINLKCRNCNGEIQMDDSSEIGFCMYCGSKFQVKDELIKIAIEHSGKVRVDKTSEVSNLIKRGSDKLEELKKSVQKGELVSVYEIVNRYFETALDMDATNDEAKRLIKEAKAFERDQAEQKREIEREIQRKKVREKRILWIVALIMMLILFLTPILFNFFY